MAIERLLFIDTNKFLDHYRLRNEAAMKLLKHAETIADRLIMTYQVEIEFKKNRQEAIKEGLDALKGPTKSPYLGIFSEAKAAKRATQHSNELTQQLAKLKGRLARALVNPAVHDPVYKVCQRLFRREGPLVLRHENTLRHTIRRRALRRFMHGCPPRKERAFSLGDSFNWEWMLHCAEEHSAELVICTSDSDYGITIDGKSYINDHLRQEFSDRVSRKRKLILCNTLSGALKEMDVNVSKKEIQAEKEVQAEKAIESVTILPPGSIVDPTIFSDILSKWNTEVKSFWTVGEDFSENPYKMHKPVIKKKE